MRKVVKRVSKEEFYKKTNMVSLMLLIYTIMLLIFSSKVIDQAGENEIDRSLYGPGFTGEAAAEGSITITAAEEEATKEGDTTSDEDTTPTGTVSKGGTILRFSPKSFEIDLLMGQTKSKGLSVTSFANYGTTFRMSSNLGEFISFDPTELFIESDESENTEVEFYGAKLGSNVGYISASGAGARNYLPVVVDVSSSREAGNVRLNLPSEFKLVESGDDLFMNIHLTGFGTESVEVVYYVKDSNNDEIVRVSHQMNVKESMDFDKSIQLPPGLRDGVYVLAVEIRYGGIVVTDSEVFTVGEAKEPFLERPAEIKGFGVSATMYRLVLVLIVGLLVLSVMLFIYETKKWDKTHQKVKKK